MRTSFVLVAVLALARISAAQEPARGWLNDQLLSRARVAPVSPLPGRPLVAPLRDAPFSPPTFRALEEHARAVSRPAARPREQHKLLAAMASVVLGSLAGFPPAGLPPQDQARLNLQYSAVNAYFTDALLRGFRRR